MRNLLKYPVTQEELLAWIAHLAKLETQDTELRCGNMTGVYLDVLRNMVTTKWEAKDGEIL
jgi:hypothetical protein